MEVTILEEAGYHQALYGFSLSYKDRAIPRDAWWWFECNKCTQVEQDLASGYPGDTCAECKDNWGDGILKRQKQIEKTAPANKHRDGGHNKFLRQIQLWVDIEAPRYFWSEFDTYKVGTVAQSESTMHTLSRRAMTREDCSDNTWATNVRGYNEVAASGEESIQALKANLPEGYLQRRVVTMNYAVLREIIKQRKDHRLPEWTTFIEAMVKSVEHPELLEDLLCLTKD